MAPEFRDFQTKQPYLMSYGLTVDLLEDVFPLQTNVMTVIRNTHHVAGNKVFIVKRPFIAASRLRIPAKTITYSGRCRSPFPAHGDRAGTGQRWQQNHTVSHHLWPTGNELFS